MSPLIRTMGVFHTHRPIMNKPAVSVSELAGLPIFFKKLYHTGNIPQN